MTGQAERDNAWPSTDCRFDDETKARIEHVRVHFHMKSTAEAIRHLVERGLAHSGAFPS